MARMASINIRIRLDDNNFPEKIEWGATDAGFQGFKDASSLLLSLWDGHDHQTFGIDLWTKKMIIEDLNVNYYQTLVRLADTYEKAARDADTADLIRFFAQQFGEKLGLLKRNV